MASGGPPLGSIDPNGARAGSTEPCSDQETASSSTCEDDAAIMVHVRAHWMNSVRRASLLRFQERSSVMQARLIKQVQHRIQWAERWILRTLWSGWIAITDQVATGMSTIDNVFCMSGGEEGDSSKGSSDGHINQIWWECDRALVSVMQGSSSRGELGTARGSSLQLWL